MTGVLGHFRKGHRAGEVTLLAAVCTLLGQCQTDRLLCIIVHTDGDTGVVGPIGPLRLEGQIVVQLHPEADLAGILRIRCDSQGLEALLQLSALNVVFQQGLGEFLVIGADRLFKFVAEYIRAIFVRRLDAQHLNFGAVGGVYLEIKHAGVGENRFTAHYVTGDDVAASAAAQRLPASANLIDQLIVAVDRLVEGHDNGDEISGIEIGINSILDRAGVDGLDGRLGFVHKGHLAVDEKLSRRDILSDPVGVEIPVQHKRRSVICQISDRHFNIIITQHFKVIIRSSKDK